MIVEAEAEEEEEEGSDGGLPLFIIIVLLLLFVLLLLLWPTAALLFMLLMFPYRTGDASNTSIWMLTMLWADDGKANASGAATEWFWLLVVVVEGAKGR